MGTALREQQAMKQDSMSTGRVLFYPARTGVHRAWVKYIRGSRTVVYSSTGTYSRPYRLSKSVRASTTTVRCTDSLISGRSQTTTFHYNHIY